MAANLKGEMTSLFSYRVLFSAAWTIAIAAPLLTAQPADTPVGFIERIDGQVTLEAGTDKITLRPKIDVARILYANEKLVCGARAVVQVQTETGEFDACAKASRPNPGGSSNRLRKDLERLESEGQRAGRDKGAGSAIYSPPDEGAVRAQTLIVRWRIRPPLAPFTAVLVDSAGKELASVPGVDGSSGQLDSPPLRDALLKYRQTASSAHEAKLIFRFASVPEQSVTFSVLTPRQEKDLEAALAENNPQTGLLRYVARAAVFESFRAYDSVAAEYDAALAEAPESRTLLRAALNAYSRTGDLHRARELRDRLAALDDPGN